MIIKNINFQNLHLLRLLKFTNILNQKSYEELYMILSLNILRIYFTKNIRLFF